jgi:hypothetical protein
MLEKSTLPPPTSSPIRHRQSQPVPRENESARDPVDVIIGRRLRARRQSLGLSQRKLEEILGVVVKGRIT